MMATSIISLTTADDTYTGAAGDHIINGLAGNDTITTGAGNSTISTGAGNATITTGAGNADVVTGNGNGTITAGAGDNIITTGIGNATITTGVGNAHIFTGNGNGTITTGAGDSTVECGAGNNLVTVGAGKNLLIYNVAANLTTTSVFHGAAGIDTLRLLMTDDELNSPAMHSDIASYHRYQLTDMTTIFHFTAFDLSVSLIKALEITNVNSGHPNLLNHVTLVGASPVAALPLYV